MKFHKGAKIGSAPDSRSNGNASEPLKKHEVIPIAEMEERAILEAIREPMETG